MEFARNPTAMQEMMRNHDRAMSNLEVDTSSDPLHEFFLHTPFFSL